MFLSRWAGRNLPSPWAADGLARAPRHGNREDRRKVILGAEPCLRFNDSCCLRASRLPSRSWAASLILLTGEFNRAGVFTHQLWVQSPTRCAMPVTEIAVSLLISADSSLAVGLHVNQA